MDDMDADPPLDVPDTPDRLIAQTNKGKRSMEMGSHISASGHSGNCNRFSDDASNGLKGSDRASRKLLIRIPNRSGKYENCSNLTFASGNSSSSSSNNSLNFRRIPGDTSNYDNKHFQPTEDNKIVRRESSIGHVVDLEEQNGQVQIGKRENPFAGRGNNQVERYREIPLSTRRLPSSSIVSSSITAFQNGSKGKEPLNRASGFDSANVIGSRTETQRRAGKFPTSLNSVSSPRVTGQKRLVRNGCISPHNIAKAKQEDEMNKNGDIDVGPRHVLPIVASSPLIGFCPTESKGKGIMASHPSQVEESTRNLVSTNEIVEEVGGRKLNGWRSTSNRSRKMNIPGSNEHQHLSSESDDTCLMNRHPGNGLTRRKIGNAPETTNNFHMGQNPTSGQSDMLPPPRHRSFKQPQLDQHNQDAKNIVTKRQRHGSSSSSPGESSVAAHGDSDIMFLGASGDRSKSSSTTQTRSCNGLSILEPIIEIDESSPEVRGDGFHASGDRATATEAMARQIEADEMLARELQEQFYNEVPSAGVDEEDVHMAMALQQEESSTHAFPRSQHVFSPRTSLMPSSTRQSQPRSSLNPSQRSSQGRGPNFNRMARLRSRFPGRPRTLSSTSSSRGRNSVFPPDMDVDMRMYILEALEAFSDMGVDNNFLQTQRELNENDYEMLLALDENNHLHGGATDHQINCLPQSTVQSDNFEEACAICLETPTIGDMIRHLPCLHKFHKDCIDPWLRRKTSCPVCKSSIT